MGLIRPRRVREKKIDYTDRHIVRKGKDPRDPFPEPIKLGAKAIAFREDEIDDYVERIEAESRGERPAWLKKQIRKLQRELREAEGKESPDDTEDDVKSVTSLPTVGG